MDTWLYPCDACAKGELVHAEATSTSDLVFGISNFAAIERNYIRATVAHIGIVPRQHGIHDSLDTSTASTASTASTLPRHYLDTSTPGLSFVSTAGQGPIQVLCRDVDH